MDAERYRGYVVTNMPRDDRRGAGEGGPGVGLTLGDGGLPSEFDNRDSSACSSSGPNTAAGERGGGRVDDVVAEGWLRDCMPIECSTVTGADGEGCPVSDGGGMMMDGGDPPTATRLRSVAGVGGNGAFVDVVPFNNIRAKYLRPMNDTALSRPYRVAPLPDWSGSRTTASSLSGSSTSSTPTGHHIDSAGNGWAMESYRGTRGKVPANHRRHSKMLKGWKQMRQWGAH